MVKHTLYRLSILLLFLLGSTIPCSHVHPTQADDECKNLAGLAVLIGCLNYIRKDLPEAPPSPDCCKGVRTIGMNCTCKLITKEIENTISMEKLVYAARDCGRPLAPGSQCGSYKVPGA